MTLYPLQNLHWKHGARKDTGTSYWTKYTLCSGDGREGTRLPGIAALPLCSKMLSLPHRCLAASPSSCLVWRAKAAASFFTSPTFALCQPPKDSAARGRKAVPCRRQSSFSDALASLLHVVTFSLTDWSKLEIGNFACLTVLAPPLLYSIGWEYLSDLSGLSCHPGQSGHFALFAIFQNF